MGDSMDMTVEFLRARLLSERSVSRAARQRADQLAKRVVELEEQLRIVTIQKKKAEKAAAKVLAILETEAIDLSSDGEVPCDDTQKENESSASSRMERSEVEDGLSGSEPGVSPSQGRSSSWKSHSINQNSHDKQRAKQIKQRQRPQSFMTTLQSSSKHQLGKSCHKIKRKDEGSAADSEIDNPRLLDVQGTGGFTFSNCCDDQPEVSLETSTGMEEAVADTSDSLHVDDHNRQIESHGSGRDEEMERVLEKQAELIGQFQAEENAQREWEQKYNEKKISTLANYEPGNCKEHSSKSTKEFSEPADRNPDNDEEATLRFVHTSSNEEPAVGSLSNADKNDRSEGASYVDFSNGFVPQVTTADSNGRCSNTLGNDLGVQQRDGVVAKETKVITQEFTASTSQCYDMVRNGKQNEVMQVSNGYPSNSRPHQHLNKTTEGTSSQPIDNHGKLPKLGPQQKNQLQLQQQLPQAPSSSLGGVLEALERAKLSLSQELSKMPSPGQVTLTLTAPTNAHTRANVSVPIGSASLFRLPSGTFHPAHFSGARYYGLGLSLPANCPDVGFATSSYGYRNPTANSYMEAGSRAVPGREYFDSSMGVPDSNRYSRVSTGLPAERTPFHSEFSKSYSDVRNGIYGVPPGGWYGLYGGDQTRSDMRML